jgi:hypothetical protein
LHDISAKAEIACLPAFPDGPEKLRSRNTAEFSVVFYFLIKQGCLSLQFSLNFVAYSYFAIFIS